MTALAKCESCHTWYDPARRSGICPHATTERDSAYLDDLTRRARAGETVGPNAKQPDPDAT